VSKTYRKAEKRKPSVSVTRKEDGEVCGDGCAIPLILRGVEARLGSQVHASREPR